MLPGEVGPTEVKQIVGLKAIPNQLKITLKEAYQASKISVELVNANEKK